MHKTVKRVSDVSEGIMVHDLTHSCFCEIFRINFLGKQLTKGGSECLSRTSNTVWSNGRISPYLCERCIETTSVRIKKSYQVYFSAVHYTQREFGKETLWSQTLKNWRRWTHLNSTPDGSMQKEVLTPQRSGNFIFLVADGTVKKSLEENSV